MNQQLIAVELLKWERRSIVLSAFGLVGFGAFLGAGAVYWIYVKRQIEALFEIQTAIIHEIQKDVENLRNSVETLKVGSDTSVTVTQKVNEFSSDDDSFLTASSQSETEDDAANIKHREKIKRQSYRSSKTEVEDQVTSFLEKVDSLLDGSIADQHEAFNTLKVNKDKLQNSSEFWWRLAKATHLEASVAASNGDKELRKAHIESAFKSAEKALKLDDTSSDAHKWFAITVGSRSDYLSLNERIQSGYTFKQHVDKAVAINPRDSGCYHLLGRFCLEVSQLSWFERKVAATLFSNPPTATAKEAYENFQESEKIKPFKENRLFMAKCCVAMGDMKRAAKWLEMASQMPIQTMSDKTAQDEVAQLFQKYKKYLN